MRVIRLYRSICFGHRRLGLNSRASDKRISRYIIHLLVLRIVFFFCLSVEGQASVTKTTVVPAKSDSDIMFCIQHYLGLIIDRSLVYKYTSELSIQDRISTQVIYRFALPQVEYKS